MGNAATIYDDKCLVYSVDKLGSCPVYEEHLETMRFITQTGKVLEKTVYQNFNVDTLPDKLRISWFQLIGKSIKIGGQALSEKDPIRSDIITTGRAEKLIGQMENEFASVCNALLLKPIQEARLYHKDSMTVLYKEFIQIEKKLILEEQNSSVGELTNDKIQLLENLRNEYQGAHYALHSHVIRIYEVLNQIKLRIPAVIEYQLEMNQYTSNYLEYVLEGFRENKKITKEIQPLKAFRSEIKSDVPDYRESIINFPKNEGRKVLPKKSNVPADSSQPQPAAKITTEDADKKDKDPNLKSQSDKKSYKDISDKNPKPIPANGSGKELNNSKKVIIDQDTDTKTSDIKQDTQNTGSMRSSPKKSKKKQDAEKNNNHRKVKSKTSLKEKKSESLTTASIYN